VIVLGCDPGYRQSAVVVWDGARIRYHGILQNTDLREKLGERTDPDFVEIFGNRGLLVIEQMQLFSTSFGVGQEIFDSVFWSGRFVEKWEPRKWDRILRSKVRGHLKASKGGDSAVRASLIDRFGPYKEEAIGTKRVPGPLYGIKADEWSALAIAVTYHDLHAGEAPQVRPGVAAEF
jgi:hypothetical protein